MRRRPSKSGPNTQKEEHWISQEVAEARKIIRKRIVRAIPLHSHCFASWRESVTKLAQ